MSCYRIRNCKELLGSLLPTLRADFAICEEYVYRSDRPLDCPISAYGGQDDPEVGQQELKAWRDQTHAAFTLRMFPGDHFFLHSVPDALLQAIGQGLLSCPNRQSASDRT